MHFVYLIIPIILSVNFFFLADSCLQKPQETSCCRLFLPEDLQVTETSTLKVVPDCCWSSTVNKSLLNERFSDGKK